MTSTRPKSLIGTAALILLVIACASDPPGESSSTTTTGDEGVPVGGGVLVQNAYGVPLHIVGQDIEGRMGPQHISTLDLYGNLDEGTVAYSDIIDFDIFGGREPDHCLEYPIVAYDPAGTEVARLDPGLCTGMDNYRWLIEDPAPDAGHILVENHTGVPVEITEEKYWPPGAEEPLAPDSPYVDPYDNIDYGEAGSGGVALRIPVGEDPDHCLEHPLVALDHTAVRAVEVARLDAGTCTGPDTNYTWLIGERPTTTTTE